jgi:hypothetical protein
LDLPTLVLAAFRAGGRFLGRFTRRLEVDLGGIDPALLGILTGTFGGLAASFGIRRFRWRPDFAASSFRFRLEWRLSISLFGILRWGLASAPSLTAAFKRRRRPGLLPSAP